MSPVFVSRVNSATSSSGRRAGIGRKRMLLMYPNMIPFTPMPRPSVSVAARMKPGLRRMPLAA